VEITTNRLKNLLNYPESSIDAISPASALYRWLILSFVCFILYILVDAVFRLSDWSMGRDRSYASYLLLAGIDLMGFKVTTPNRWCHEGRWPAEAEQYRLSKT
jgi:hypothetical protein